MVLTKSTARHSLAATVSYSPPPVASTSHDGVKTSPWSATRWLDLMVVTGAIHCG